MLPPLYDESGALRLETLSTDAQEVMHAVTRWLRDIGRGIYLPLDLMIVLLQRGHIELGYAIAGSTVGTVDIKDVQYRLRELGREIEDRHQMAASLERDAFSRSFARILDEAWEQAQGRGHTAVGEQDLMRAIMWRAEVTESASVRWAIKRLAEGGGDRLFDNKSQLKREVFDNVSWGFLQAAMQMAARSGTPFLGTPHLIASFCSVRDSVVWRAAISRGLEPSRLREELLRIIGAKPGPLPDFLLGRKTLTPRMVRMLSYAMREAMKVRDNGLVSERHLVKAFLDDGGSSLELVQALGLESEVTKALNDSRVLESALDIENAVKAHAVWDAAPPTPTLDQIGRDLTRQAREGKLPRIIGRDRELQRVINVLLRKEQRNPLLTGEAGVGKTALAVALAQRIADGTVPSPLLGQRVVEINGASLMSGTSYRGELESRIKSLLNEAGKGVILFIDEAHAVFAPRTGSHGPAEIPNHFKSALASGEIAVVGATTEAEYRRWIDQDPALKRRFERIEICEPSHRLTLQILRGLANSLETDYEVTLPDEVLRAALDYSIRYLPEQRLPDKAKKLLMDAAIAAAHPLDQPHDAPAEERPIGVERRHLAQQVSYRTGIPVERLVRGQDDWWTGLEERLKGQFMAQDAAVSQSARCLIASRLRPRAQARPLATLAFFGPNGTGKGTMARIIAQEVFGDPRAFIRLDMTDFAESHTISRLIGSPPGYVGYEDEDMLVTPLRRRPSCVVLLEDIDKAHPRILERLLRLFDEGEITDTRGLTADARQAVFIMTLDMETNTRNHGGRIGFGGGHREALATGEALFKERSSALYLQLRGHVDAFIPFKSLDQHNNDALIKSMLVRYLGDLTERLQEEYGITLTWTSEAIECLSIGCAQEGCMPSEGFFQDRVIEPLTDALLGGTLGQGKSIRLDGVPGEDASINLSVFDDEI